MDEQKERKSFEEWFESEAILEHSNWFSRDATGMYKIDFVEWAWSGWCARARYHQ